MHIERLYLQHFRNYGRLELGLTPGINFFYGPNAAGKTNILEAVYVLSTAGSHRTHRDREWIQIEEQRALLKVLVEQSDGRVELALYQDRSGSKGVKVNGVSQRRLVDLIGELKVVFFSPEDLSLVKGGPDERRRLLDNLGAQMSRRYYSLRQEYRRALSQRNSLLKAAGSPGEQLAVWESQLLDRGSALTARRQEMVSQLRSHAAAEHDTLSEGQALTLRYSPGGIASMEVTSEERDPEGRRRALREALADRMEARRGEALEKGYTLVGPHRDDIVFEVNGRDCRSFGSQGQQRTVVLAVKLAEQRLLQQDSGRSPVVLLDDVVSELDARRCRRLLERAGTSGQTLITGTERLELPGSGDRPRCVFRVEDGTVEMVDEAG